MSYIEKLKSSLPAHGFLRQAARFVFKVYRYIFLKPKYNRIVKQLNIQDRIFLWTAGFGWNVTLFQRPQHIARCLAKSNNTVFYYSNPIYDQNIDCIKEIYPNLYLVDRNNTSFIRTLENYLKKSNSTKYFHLYSTNLDSSLEELKAYEQKGFHVLYEYIDDLAPEISATTEVPAILQEKFDYVTSCDRIPMAVTADLLYQQIVSLRGSKNLAFSTNGVDPAHFRNIKENFVFSDVFQKVLDRGNKIVGYYGAMAKWLDYDLLKIVAAKLPNVDFVLIGKKYDESYDASGIDAVPNIHFIGPVAYQDLPQYSAKFDVSTIPFVVNSITNATSPLKLFEYMASGKPVLTTAMQESSKYEAVNIAHNAEEFAEKILQLLSYTPETQPEYFALLDATVEANAWEAKTDLILNMLADHEASL